MNRLADPRTDDWQYMVKQRASWRCQYPGCTTPKDRVQAHHKLPWSKYPSLRFQVDNGIALCHKHHAMADRANRNNYGV